MKYEVDQSVKVEQTNRNTIIAIANDKYAYTLKIDSKIKQSIQKYFNKIKKPKMFAVYLFTAGLIVLIKKSKIQNSVAIIDLEYYGYNKIIENELNKNINQKLEFRFSRIGKKSPAHNLAYLTFKRRIKPNYIINKSELEKIVLKMIR